MSLQLTELEKAYFAGLVDGEGCIGIYKRTNRGYFVQVSIVNTNQPVMEWLGSRIGANTLKPQSDKRPRNKQSFIITIDRMRAAEFLEAILPYLRIKYEQAKLALRFKDWQNSRKLNGPFGHRKYSKDDIETADAFVANSHSLNRKGRN